MRNSILLSKVNFGISAVFIGLFGLFMVNMVLKVANLENPIIDVTATAMGIENN